VAALAVPQWDGGSRRATAHCWDDVRRGMHTQTRARLRLKRVLLEV